MKNWTGSLYFVGILALLSTSISPALAQGETPTPETPSPTPSETPPAPEPTLTPSATATTGTPSATPTSDASPTPTEVPLGPPPPVGIDAALFETGGFVANLGQAPEEASFLVHGGDHNIAFGQFGLSFELTFQMQPVAAAESKSPSVPAPYFNSMEGEEVATIYETAAVQLAFAGANPPAPPEGIDPLPVSVNYYLGADPAAWQEDVPVYAGLLYRDLYPGIDLEYRIEGEVLKSTFIVHPGADPGTIRMVYLGELELSLQPSGDLLVTTEAGALQERAPAAFQELDGARTSPEVAFAVEGIGVGFSLPAGYDPALPLYIDPELTYASYLGSGGDEDAADLAVANNGDIYIAGVTTTSGSNRDGLLVRLSPDKTYQDDEWTVFGGAGTDRPTGLTLGADGSVYVVGWTSSPGGFDGSYGGEQDAFFAKFSANTRLVFKSYLGGNGFDRSGRVAYDPTMDRVYLVGRTASTDFPRVEAVQSDLDGGVDAFLTAFSPGGSLEFSTYYGGGADDVAYGLAVRPNGAVLFGGTTSSPDFPTQGPTDDSYAGNGDAFVAQYNPSLGRVTFSRFLGGSGFDEITYALAVDDSGQIYIGGVTTTQSTDPVPFPISAGAFQPEHGGGTYDAFVARLTVIGEMSASTYLGGSEIQDGVVDLEPDGTGGAFLAGYTSSDYTGSKRFPVTADAYQPDHGGGVNDDFMAHINSDATNLLYATYLGGDGDEGASFGIEVSRGGPPWSVTIVGHTASSSGFPLVNPQQPDLAGGQDLFLVEFDGLIAPPPWITSVYVNSSSPVLPVMLGFQLGSQGKDGLVILDFGPPRTWNTLEGVAYGTQLFSYPERFTTDQIREWTKSFMQGWWFGYWNVGGVGRNPDAQLAVAVGTNNCNTRYNGECIAGNSNLSPEHARAWAEMIQEVLQHLVETGMVSRIWAHGANDIELAWNSPQWTLPWVEAFSASLNNPTAIPANLIDFGTCEACNAALFTDSTPDDLTDNDLDLDYIVEAGGNFWPLRDVWQKAYGSLASLPVPEIYLRSETNAKQWYVLSRYSVEAQGYPILFPGVLTTCQTISADLNCQHKEEGNTPDEGWSQLLMYLDADVKTRMGYIRWLTDIQYLSRLVQEPCYDC